MMSEKNERRLRYPYLRWVRSSDVPNEAACSQRAYYFIDFGLAVHVKERDCRALVIGNEGHDKDPPELSKGNRVPYDPYKLDVYLIGNVFRQVLLDVSGPDVSI